jgi:hypothetical protein
MGKDLKHRDWKKYQPHQVDTGKITTRKYAEKHPGKVEWVAGKGSKK